ncbi:MAG: hypothetical protein QM783_13330 [Phycisphaerales bacterium]
MQAQPTTDTTSPLAPPSANTPTTTTPPPQRCTPTLIDSAQADAIEALQAILKETAPLDIFDDLPERTRASDQTDDTNESTDAPRRHSPRGRALRLSIRLRAATALLRIRVATPSPSFLLGEGAPRSSEGRMRVPRSSDSTNCPTRTRSASPNPQSEFHNPQSLSPDTNDEPAPKPRSRSAREVARDEAAAKKAKADRTLAMIEAGNQQAYQNLLEIRRQADLRIAAEAAANSAAAAATSITTNNADSTTPSAHPPPIHEPSGSAAPSPSHQRPSLNAALPIP